MRLIGIDEVVVILDTNVVSLPQGGRREDRSVGLTQ